MMRRLIIYVCVAAMAASLLSCSQKQEQTSARLTLAIDNSADLSDAIQAASKGKVSDYTTLPQSEDFNITLYKDDSKVWSGPLSSWNTLTPLVCGQYKVLADYGKDAGEGFDKPYFSGEHAFTLKSDTPLQTETVSVSLANCVVRYEFTDAFKKCFTSYVFAMTTGADNIFVIPNESDRAVFVDAFKFTLAGTMTGQNGVVSAMAPKTYEGLKAGTCYLLRFDASQMGGVTRVSISFDDSLENIDLGVIEMN